VYVVSALVKAGRIKFRQRFHSYRQQTQDATLTALPAAARWQGEGRKEEVKMAPNM
jgi:hypothetical protein